MSNCPDCGRLNVSDEWEGYEALCGRRVSHSELMPDDWRARMLIAQTCREAGEHRRRISEGRSKPAEGEASHEPNAKDRSE